MFDVVIPLIVGEYIQSAVHSDLPWTEANNLLSVFDEINVSH